MRKNRHGRTDVPKERRLSRREQAEKIRSLEARAAVALGRAERLRFRLDEAIIAATAGRAKPETKLKKVIDKLMEPL